MTGLGSVSEGNCKTVGFLLVLCCSVMLPQSSPDSVLLACPHHLCLVILS